MIHFFSKKSTRFIELVVDEGSDLSDKDIERAKRFFFLLLTRRRLKDTMPTTGSSCGLGLDSGSRKVADLCMRRRRLHLIYGRRRRAETIEFRWGFPSGY